MIEGHRHDQYATAEGVANGTERVYRVSPGGSIAQALTRATSGGTVLLAPGTHTVTSQLALTSNVTLAGEPGAVLDISGVASGTPAIAAVGTYGSNVTLTADAVKGATTITLTSTSGIAAGDYLKVSSAAVFSSVVGQHVGEIVKVASVSSPTVTVEDPLNDTYATADSAKIQKLTLVENPTVRGLSIVGPAADTSKEVNAVQFKLVSGGLVERVRVKYAHYAGVQFYDTIFSQVRGCDFSYCLWAGYAYGVQIIYTCQDITVSDCTGRKLRHLVTIGGGSGYGVNRRIATVNCTASELTDAGFDCHPSGEFISYTGCHVQGSDQDGFSIQGGVATVTGCTATGSARHGFLIQNMTDRGSSFTLNGCVSTDSANIGIYCDLGQGYETYSGVTVTGCRVTDSGEVGIHIQNADTGTAGVAVTGNVVRRANGSNGALYLRGLDAPIVSGNSLHTTSSSYVLRLYESPDAVITGNVLSTDSSTYGLGFTSTSPDGIASNNNISGATTGVYSDSGSTGVVYANNVNTCATPTSLSGTIKQGFYATQPIVKPAVTGAKAGNAALASLLTELANLGLLADSTT